MSYYRSLMNVMARGRPPTKLNPPASPVLGLALSEAVTREVELRGVILAVCRAWDIYDSSVELADDSLNRLDRELQAAADLIGHKRGGWRRSTVRRAIKTNTSGRREIS